MLNRERMLVIAMRIVGVLGMLGVVFVFVPYSLMNAIHERLLGMGPLPAEPIVGYLARSISYFYFFQGTLLVLMSMDVNRYRPIIFAALVMMLASGLIHVGVDLAEGLPALWTGREVPILIGSSLIMLWLLRSVRSE